MIAFEVLGEFLHRLIPELIRLLDDRRLYDTFGDAFQGLLIFVEADDLDLAFFTGRLYRIVDLRSVIGPKP